MNIFLVIALAMLLIIILLRRHIPIGPAILAGGLLIWALVAPQFHYLVSAFTTTLTMQRTYDLILALYFVMCLEIELRTSGALDGMIRALQRLFAFTETDECTDIQIIRNLADGKFPLQARHGHGIGHL